MVCCHLQGITWLVRGLRSDLEEGIESITIPERKKLFGLNSTPPARFSMSISKIRKN